MNDIIKEFEIQLDVLSPVHIGTGDGIDPFSYVLRRREHDGKLEICRYDFMELLKLADPQNFNKIKELSRIPVGGNFLKIREIAGKIIKQYPSLITDTNEIPETDFFKKYNEGTESASRLMINETYKDGGVLTIPGSSLKGAIRTAIIQEACMSVYETIMPEQANSVASKLFENINISEDPFKILSVDDIHFNIPKLAVGYYHNYWAQEITPKPRKEKLTQVAEVLMIQPSSKFKIRLKNYLLPNNHYKQLAKVIEDVCTDGTKLFEVINKHYRWLFEQEYRLLKSGSPNNKFVRIVEKNNLISSLYNENRWAFIKVGFHSGSLGVTLKHEACEALTGGKPCKNKSNKPHCTRKLNVKIDGERVKDGDKPSTIGLFSLKDFHNVKPEDLYPSGWLMLTTPKKG